MPYIDLYKVVGKGLHNEKQLREKLVEWNVKQHHDMILAQLKNTGRWTDGEIRILTVMG